MKYCEYCYDDLLDSEWNIFVYKTTVDIEYMTPYIKIIKDTKQTLRLQNLTEFWKKRDSLCVLSYFGSSMHYNCVFTLLDSIEQKCIINKLQYIINLIKHEKTIEIMVNYNLN